FINQLKASRPELESQQLAGRALLCCGTRRWTIWTEYREGQVEQKPYVYQTNAD
ncbi:MAG: DUF3460 family protein, partial [Gammaproteobacteria bacterium]